MSVFRRVPQIYKYCFSVTKHVGFLQNQLRFTGLYQLHKSIQEKFNSVFLEPKTCRFFLLFDLEYAFNFFCSCHIYVLRVYVYTYTRLTITCVLKCSPSWLQTLHITQDVPELLILLLPCPECQDYRWYTEFLIFLKCLSIVDALSHL